MWVGVLVLGRDVEVSRGRNVISGGRNVGSEFWVGKFEM